MKRILTLSLFLLAVNGLTRAQEITFSETKVEWGTVQEKNGDISHDFQFMNTGDKPLLIKNVITSCGCTSAEWSKEAYQPGEKGSIRLIYHPQGRTETDINLVAEVYSNRASKGTVNLEITGHVTHEAPVHSSYFNPATEERVISTFLSLKMNMSVFLNVSVQKYTKKLPRQKQMPPLKSCYVQ